MNPNELQKLKKLSILPILLIVIIYCLPTFLISPEQEACESAISEMETSLKDGKKALELTSEIMADEKKLSSLKNVIVKADALFPSKDKLPDLIDELHLIAAESSISLDNVHYRFSDIYENIQIPSYQFDMRVAGDYASVRSFITGVEKMSNPTFITEILLGEGTGYTVKMRAPIK